MVPSTMQILPPSASNTTVLYVIANGIPENCCTRMEFEEVQAEPFRVLRLANLAGE